MILYAPAKVNLRLKVLDRRPDGFHNIDTVFEKIDLFDKIVISSLPYPDRKKRSVIIKCDAGSVPTGKDSLVHRAVDLLRKRCKVEKGVRIRIFKRIPVAAGLGGGSSDAASVLLGLKRFWKLPLSQKDLVRIGGKLGSDVPFFLHSASFAIGSNRGDVVRPVTWKIKLWHLLISCPEKLLSKEVYGTYAAGRTSCLTKTPNANRIASPAPRIKDFRDALGILENDLEGVVLAKRPLVAKIKESLKDLGCAGSLVSGSGPSVFGLFRNRKEALSVKRLFTKRFPVSSERGWQIFVVSTL